MTPTSGGSATGRATRPPSSRRPGNSRRAKTKASGTPTSAASATEAAEIHRLRHSASHSSPRRAKAAKCSRVSSSGAPSASSRVSSSG